MNDCKDIDELVTHHGKRIVLMAVVPAGYFVSNKKQSIL